MTVNASAGEGWGLSVVEANALGVPALAYRRPGLRDSIRHGETGWLIDDEDNLADAIAAALRGARTTRRSPRELSERAQRWAAKFTWREMASQMMGILQAEQGRLDQRTTGGPTPIWPPWSTCRRRCCRTAGGPTSGVVDKWTMNGAGLGGAPARSRHRQHDRRPAPGRPSRVGRQRSCGSSGGGPAPSPRLTRGRAVCRARLGGHRGRGR